MNKNLNLRNLLICSIFYLSVIGILFLYWQTGKSLVIFTIPAGTLLLLIIDYKNFRFDKPRFILLFLLLFLIIINLCIPVKREYIVDALVKGTFFPLFVGVYFLKLKEYKNLKKHILNPMFIILNLYCFINFFIMLKQVSTPGFMVHNRSENTYYIDMITGLIGENGTHKLSFVFISCLYLNYYYIHADNKKIKILSTILFFFILISSLYISTFNDNRMYYFLLALSLIPMIVIQFRTKKLTRTKLVTSLLLFFGITLSCLFTYTVNSQFKQFINENIIDNYFNKTISGLENYSSDSSDSGEERLHLLKYSITNTNIFIGKGIGSIHMTRDPSVPKHFGLNDIIVRIYTGGIFFALLIILIYNNFFGALFNKKNLLIRFFILALVIVAAFYTQSYSQIEKTFLIGLSFFMISGIYNKKIDY